MVEGELARGYPWAVQLPRLAEPEQGRFGSHYKAPDDAALLHRILQRADVLIQNPAPGTAARAGFRSVDLRQRFPRLITVEISGRRRA